MDNKYTEKELNNTNKSVLVKMMLDKQAQEDAHVTQIDVLVAENSALIAQNKELIAKVEELDKKFQLMIEQLVLSKKNRFGRSSEKMTDYNQLRFVEVDGELVLFNEAEATANLEAEEPETLEPRRGTKTKGKRERDMAGIKAEVVEHYMSDEELTAKFGENGWKPLPDDIVRKYHFTPASVTVKEHHIGVYASKEEDLIVRAPHPKWLLPASPVSPSIAAAVINGKYVNAVPLYRLEREFERYGLAITRQNMANWMIRLAEEYLGILYDYLHERLYDYHVIQADETPVLVNKDDRPAGSKSYMWVYRSGHLYADKQIILYEYQRTRNASHPREFLKNYSGICVTDGYQVYHTVENEIEDLTIAGCWVHCRRKFDEALEVIPKEARKGTLSYMVMKQIQAIYREEEKLKNLEPEDRLKQRQVVVKPLVDALFVYLKTNEAKVGGGTLKKAFTYALNQEKYLRVFLNDGEVPIDNNASERAIRGFCIGKKNWTIIDTIRGAKSSAIIYSLVETAKANNLKPYEYFNHVLTVLPEHMDDTNRSFLEDLMPWSPNLPDDIRKKGSK